jgi:hypothetical protein
MAAVTNNVTLTPGGGWTALTSANVSTFMIIRHHPHHVPIFITVASSPPTGPATGGFRIDDGEQIFNTAITGNVYARIQNNSNANVSVSVFAN